MNGSINNITLSNQEYNLLISYRKADLNFKNAVNRLLNLPDKIIPFPKRKELTQ